MEEARKPNIFVRIIKEKTFGDLGIHGNNREFRE
jgi:hypothetical protein